MIPKIIHYCWFGGNSYPKRELKCFKSWDKHFRDYERIRWDETNFDVHCNKYVEEAYSVKEYRYVSDYARLIALYNQGGLYLDTDCLIKKSFDSLLDNSAFTGYGGDNREIAAHIIAVEKHNDFIKECLDSYIDEMFILEDGSYNLYTINQRMTDILIKHGFNPNGKKQIVHGLTIYPMTYFCPISMLPDTVKDCFSKDTYCVHVWSSKELKRERNPIIRFAHKTGLNKVKRKIVNIIK